jgi:hypothetical protein
MAIFKSERHKVVGLVTGHDAYIRLLVQVTAADESAFVGPVHEVFPVWLMVLKEFAIEL